MSQEEIRFPEELATDVKRLGFYVIENGDISTSEDLNHLVELMFQFPERSFYLFTRKGEGANHLVVTAEHRGILWIEQWETHYYPHSNFKRDWIRIDKPNLVLDWGKEVRANSPEYIRFTLKLTERWRRKLELREAFAETEKSEDTNPLVLKPSFFGIGIDLPKAWKWVARRWRGQS
ncbi:MAG: hypothetical protein KIT13_08915 [Burkholderiales bacterium]|nr:hypothetical protein [Burkholderiales bacterium]